MPRETLHLQEGYHKICSVFFRFTYRVVNHFHVNDDDDNNNDNNNNNNNNNNKYKLIEPSPTTNQTL